MDYPAVIEIYNIKKNFRKYIAMMQLAAYRSFGRGEIYPPREQKAYLQPNKAMGVEKIILTKRAGGDWNCVIERVVYNEGKFILVRVSVVIDKSNIPASLEFKMNDECLYKMEIIEKNDTQ